jgi:pyruvate/2-oxoglutarate dehydrogenase complex dihydrolipoamide dehydrogenase (E3) component
MEERKTPLSEPISIRPMDEHNRKLVGNVHPADWINPTPPSSPYDMVVVGAGTAGLITAIGSAGLGKRVALLERHLMGGDCLNVGCVPSKALIRAAAAASAVRHAEDFGVSAGGDVSIDFPKVMERLRRLRASISVHDSAKRYAEQGIDVYLGDGRFAGPDTIDIAGASLRFKKACIATGARAAAPAIAGLEGVDYLTNESVFELTELPSKLAVIGAGPIGCELSQAFARLGSEVYLIEAAHGVLPNEDPDASEIVRRSIVGDAVHLLCCSQHFKLAAADGGGVRLQTDSHGRDYDLRVDRLLVAVGRKPNTDGLGLEAANVTYDQRGVTVDDHLRTTNPRIYAAGDICSKYKFTHAADANARIVIRNALLGWIPRKARASDLVVPWCTYTDPEIAHVGRYPKELDQAGVRYETVTVDLAAIDRAILESDIDGLLKVHVRPNGKILGATLVSRHAGESISEITTAMVHGIKLQHLSKVIHPYPTQAEVIKRAGDQFFKRWLLGWRQRLTFSGRADDPK